MEKMSIKEQEMLTKLQAKQKRIQRAEAEFWNEVESRADEVKKHLNVQTKRCEDCLDKVARLYGISADELLEYISTEKQINYFKATEERKRFTN